MVIDNTCVSVCMWLCDHLFDINERANERKKKRLQFKLIYSILMKTSSVLRALRTQWWSHSNDTLHEKEEEKDISRHWYCWCPQWKWYAEPKWILVSLSAHFMWILCLSPGLRDGVIHLLSRIFIELIRNSVITSLICLSEKFEGVYVNNVFWTFIKFDVIFNTFQKLARSNFFIEKIVHFSHERATIICLCFVIGATVFEYSNKKFQIPNNLNEHDSIPRISVLHTGSYLKTFIAF